LQFDNIILQSGGGGGQSTTGVQSVNGATGHVTIRTYYNYDTSYVLTSYNGVVQPDSLKINRKFLRDSTNITFTTIGDTTWISSLGGGGSLPYNGDPDYYLGGDTTLHPLPTVSGFYGTYYELSVDGTTILDGDTTYTNSSFINKQIALYREGDIMQHNTSYGYAFDSTIGKIDFYPALSYGEKLTVQTIFANDSSVIYVPTLEYLLFPTNTGLVNTSNVWTGTNSGSSYADYGLSNRKLASGFDGYIQARFANSSCVNGIIAFNTTNASQPYTSGYEAAAWVLHWIALNP